MAGAAAQISKRLPAQPNTNSAAAPSTEPSTPATPEPQPTNNAQPQQTDNAQTEKKQQTMSVLKDRFRKGVGRDIAIAEGREKLRSQMTVEDYIKGIENAASQDPTFGSRKQDKLKRALKPLKKKQEGENNGEE